MLVDVIQQRKQRNYFSLVNGIEHFLYLEARLIVQADQVDKVDLGDDSVPIGCSIHVLSRAQGGTGFSQVGICALAFGN